MHWIQHHPQLSKYLILFFFLQTEGEEVSQSVKTHTENYPNAAYLKSASTS